MVFSDVVHTRPELLSLVLEIPSFLSFPAFIYQFLLASPLLTAASAMPQNGTNENPIWQVTGRSLPTSK